MDRISRIALVLGVVALLMIAAITKTFSIGAEIDLLCDGGVWELTPSPADHIMAGCVEDGPTATATPTPANTPTATPTTTPEPVGSVGGNLLTNPGFANGFDGWLQQNGHWTSGSKWNPCESGGDAQSDQDWDRNGNVWGWPTGAEDWLWQDVGPPDSYSQVTFRSQEIQHHGDNAAVITIYGHDGSEWVMLWQRPALDFPKATSRDDWHAREYTFSVDQPYPQLRLEFYGRVDAGLEEGEDVGWKFSCLELEAS